MYIRITYKGKVYECETAARSRSGIIKTIKSNKDIIVTLLGLYTESDIAHIIVLNNSHDMSVRGNYAFAGCICRDIFKSKVMIIMEKTEDKPLDWKWSELEAKCKI